jgi:hypothetical protein
MGLHTAPCGERSSAVELSVVVRAVVGSNPIVRPILLFKIKDLFLDGHRSGLLALRKSNADLAFALAAFCTA